MRVETKVKLADARAVLGISQAVLASAASVSKTVVVRAENDQAIQRIQAHRILNALNSYRKLAGEAPLSITNIDWRIHGE